MRRTSAGVLAGLSLAVGLAGCSGSRTPVQAAPAPAATPAATASPAAANRPAANPADVAFMSGMIHHHRQAVLIAGWAPSHGASEAIQRLCERIVVGQGDEIDLLSRWLEDHGLPVPAPDTAMMLGATSHAGMNHGAMGPGAMDHSQMPGMLSAAELKALDAARGPAFDRLFLEDMIKHHKGALVMVDQLFGSQGGGQDEDVFRLASNVYADQSTEIGRMQKMLDALPSPSH
ncbi:MAG TPA: DUF305 domain-containing protein [Gemmatimonadales bacterium]|nr:DUF305 domain-containing protein [Gemmatimonadales bacterium]